MKQTWRTNAAFCSAYRTSLKERHINLHNVNDSVRVTPEYFELFWMPDTFVSNAKSIFMQSQVLRTQSLSISLEASKNESSPGELICAMEYLGR